MDRIGIILGYEWRAYWRRLSRAGMRAGNQGIVLIFSLLIAVKYFQLLWTASSNVANGSARLLGSLLAAIFLVWLFPLAGNKRDTLASRKWLHLPLALHERFIVRAVSLLMPPSAWLVVAASLAICYPLAHARNPVAGIIAGLFFITTAWLTGLTISHLLNHSGWRRLFGFAALAVMVIAGVYVTRGGDPRSLLDFPFFPAVLVERAAMGVANHTWFGPLISVATLGALSVVAGVTALWSFEKSLSAPPTVASEKFSILALNLLPGRLGGLVAKDLRYFRRLLDTYLGLAAAILTCVYLVVAEVPSAGIFWSFIAIVFLCNAAMPFNSCGLDNRRGMDRYSLLPLSGKAILLSKNLAYLTITMFQILPVLMIAGWRLGIVTTALGLLEAVVLACAYLTWGNWMSVNHPLKMQFYRFANSGAAVVDAMGGIIFGSLPGIVLIYLWQGPGLRAVWGTAFVLLLTGSLYLLSLRRFGRRFEHTRERIAEALA